MKIAVLMFYDDAIKEYGDITYKINKLYCEKYNVELIVSNKKIFKNRHPAWERLPLILEHIAKYDYLIWIDADAFFYIDSKNIINIIKENIDTHFIFSKDLGNKDINTGVFIVKNTQYSIDFINKWTYDDELYKMNPHPYWWDQGVLIDMFNKNINNIQNNSIRFDYGILQHFSNHELQYFTNKPFILHLAGKRNTQIRTNTFLDYYNKITQQNC